MFENITPYLFYKLFLFIPLIIVFKFAVRNSVKEEKNLGVFLNFVGVLFILGLFYITFKYT